MRISFKRNGFIALASMLSFAVYAGDNLPLATAASGTNGSIQVSEHGVDTSNEIQQARVIQGTVLEEGTNEPLIGVNVVVKGTTIGTTTDVEGKYSIRIPSDNAVLVFSYIGQKTEEYSVNGNGHFIATATYTTCLADNELVCLINLFTLHLSCFKIPSELSAIKAETKQRICYKRLLPIVDVI